MMGDSHTADEMPMDTGESAWACDCGEWSGIYATAEDGLAAHWGHIISAAGPGSDV